VASPLLLDEMFSDAIAARLRTMGHDVRSVVAIPVVFLQRLES
jgi:hypothetical protein